MTKEIRDSFIMYRSFIEMAKEMDDKNRLAFYDAICDLALDGKETELFGMAKMAFIGAKPNILANTKKYENGKKGAKHGFKGGRPKKPLNNPSGVLKNNPKKTPNVNYNENKDENKDEKLKIIIPNFIDQILFDEFLNQRKKDKSKLEGLALKLTIEDLKKWEKEKSGSANEALRNAIKGNWKSLIQPRQNNYNNTQKPIGMPKPRYDDPDYYKNDGGWND